jgi:gliding motility-associated peptidyl-prolyl isomerase
MKKYILVVIGMLLVMSCNKEEARRPISYSSGSYKKATVDKNIKLVANEEKIIDSIMKSTPEKEYLTSKKGFWYTYDQKNETDTLRPKGGDIAYFEYELNDLYGNVIYTTLELRSQQYLVDKQEIMIGLRHGIKLMRKNEKVTFLFPSHVGYGYLGDKNRIGPNVPLKCTVTLTDFKPVKTSSTIEPIQNLE